MKFINKKYTIEVFRDENTGSFYYSNTNNPDYYNRNDTIAGIYILDIINNYPNLKPYSVLVKGKELKNIPSNLFVEIFVDL